MAGVSTATVSKYINGITVKEANKLRIDAAIESLGFKVNVIARGLKTNRTMTVGVLIPSLENIFATTIVSHIERVLLQHGYSTIICDYNHDAELECSKFNFLLEKSVDGIIIMPLEITAEKAGAALSRDIPVVLLDRPVMGLDCDVVLVDNLNASYNAIEKLIMLGHREIGIICGPQNIFTAQERLKGYKRVHEDYNLPIDGNNIQYGDYGIQSGYEIMMGFLKRKTQPTAVFVTNYEMTLGAIMAINAENVKIPAELSFIGFDNQQLAQVIKPSPAIIVQPIQQIGESAANLIIRKMKGNKEVPAMLRLKTEFMEGQSISYPSGKNHADITP